MRIKNLLAAIGISATLFAASALPAEALPASWSLLYGNVLSHNVSVSSNSNWHVNVYKGSPGTAGATVDQLVFQADCNLVKYRWDTSSGVAKNQRAVWSSRTSGVTNCTLDWQIDGNMVIYDWAGAIWNTGTNYGIGPNYQFVLRSDGWMYIQIAYAGSWSTVWSIFS